MTDTTPEPTLAELELREALYEAMDGNLRMSRRRKLLGEYRDAILASAAPVVVPAADRAALRDRIRRAVCEAEGFAWDSDMLEPDEYGDVADMVLSVLPAPADRAAVLTEAAEAVAALDRRKLGIVADTTKDAWEEGRDEGVDLLRRMAAESAVVDRVAAETPPAETHSCGNCDGIDPDTCLMNPNRPPEQCPRSEADGYGLQCQKPAGHNLCTFEEQPGPVVVAQPGKDTETP